MASIKFPHNPAYFTIAEPSSLATEHIVAEKCDGLYALTKFLLLRKKWDEFSS